jgi:hypothetical protein
MKFLKKIRKKLYRICFYRTSKFAKIGYFFLKKKIKLSKNDIALISIHNAGETYLTCAMIDSFKMRHGIHGSVILLGTKLYHKQIYEMFSHKIDRYYQLDPYIAECLQYLRTIKNGEIFYTADLNKWTASFLKSPLNHLTHFKLLKICNFMDVEVELSSPLIKLEYEINAQKKFDQLGLIRNKTIIISPESTSLKSLDNVFWKNLCFKLSNYDYKIFLNIMDKKNSIAGIASGFLNFSEAFVFTNLAGKVIAARSGFCDVLSSSNAEFHVIYPTQIDREIYPLNEFVFEEKLAEYSANEQSQERLIEIIVKKVTQSEKEKI